MRPAAYERQAWVQCFLQKQSHMASKAKLCCRHVNLVEALLGRELAPHGQRICSTGTASVNVDRVLSSCVEADLLKRCSATYCQLNPPPRSTIAAAFSNDGRLLASAQ